MTTMQILQGGTWIDVEICDVCGTVKLYRMDAEGPLLTYEAFCPMCEMEDE